MAPVRRRCLASAFAAVILRSLLVLALEDIPVSAQAPDLISFQGLLTDAGGTPSDGNVSITFKLYKNNVAVWTETHPAVAVTNGVYNVLLGSITPLNMLAFNQPLELGIKVGADPEITPRTPVAATPFALGMRGMYAVYAADGIAAGYNVVGGASSNSVGGGVVGATIGGGGGTVDEISTPNTIIGDFGTISGGSGNSASGSYATVGGGFNNSAASGGTVGGGQGNSAGFQLSVVGGGLLNTASASLSTVGGGGSNQSTAWGATIAGGEGNAAGANYAAVGGGSGNSATGIHSVVAGGTLGVAGGPSAAVVGGSNNRASGSHAFVAGGLGNRAGGTSAAVPGGFENRAQGVVSFAAGHRSRANHDGVFIWNDRSVISGDDSLVSTGPNQFLIRAAGGVAIGTNSPRAMLTLRGPNDPVMGPSLYFTGNASDQFESGRIRFVEGTTPSNQRGAYIHMDGAGNDFHIGIHNASDALPENDQNIITIERDTGDLGIQRADPGHPIHVGNTTADGNGAHVTDAGVWTNGSSRTFKEGFEDVDKSEILSLLSSLPVLKWRYSGEDPSAHIGPTAEDFRAAFGLGHDERYITTVDADGVALAAIQGLLERLVALEAEVANLREQLGEK